MGNEYSKSQRGNAFQTMEGMLIYHDSQVARNHLEKLKGFPIYLFGEVNQRVKSILERHFVNYEAPAVYPEHVISGILHLQRCEVLLQNMIISQRTSLVKSMIEVMKIPLDSYEDFLFSKSAFPSTTACWKDLCGSLTANTTSSGVNNLRHTNYL